jgi:pathogenesis-related protein 1
VNKSVSTLTALCLTLVLYNFVGCAIKIDDDNFFGPRGTRVLQTNPSTEPGGSAQGRLEGIVQAHNTVRASIDAEPSLEALIWSDELAEVAQKWADHLREQGCDMRHSSSGFGENLAWFAGDPATAEEVVQGWASESDCYTFGRFMQSDECSSACKSSGGCGHYTQVIWRNTSVLGCGIAVCDTGFYQEIWVCNYDPPGNFVGEYPY